MNLIITENAQIKLQEIIVAEAQSTKTKVRVAVQGGGCSGMQYSFILDDDQNEDDWEIPAGSQTVLVDSMSAQYLMNAEIDYIDDLNGSRFNISNPQAQTTCGCGSSFSPS